jgi:hypothetical protein
LVFLESLVQGDVYVFHFTIFESTKKKLLNFELLLSLKNAEATREIIRQLRSDKGNNEAKGDLA